MSPVAITGLPIQRYHAAQLASSQERLEKSVLAYNTLACVYGSEVVLSAVALSVMVARYAGDGRAEESLLYAREVAAVL